MLLRHSIVYLFARGIPGLVGFATVIIYTRLFSPESYGQYTLVITGTVLCNAILYQWLSASLLRFLPQYSASPDKLLAAILSGFILVSIITGVIGTLLVIKWGNTIWGGLIVIGVLITWAQAWLFINLELMRSRLAPMRYGLVNMLKSIIALGCGVLLVMLGYQVYGALLGILIGFLIAGIWSSWRQWSLFKLQLLDRDLIKKLLVYGLPLTASFSLTVAISSTDRFMLAAIVDESATGLYAASQGLAQQAVAVLMMMVNLAAYPLILRALEDVGADAARDQLRKNAIILLGVGLPMTIIFLLLSADISSIFLGIEYQTAGTELMPWIAIATLIAGIRTYYFDLAFYLGNRTRVYIVVMGAAALLNIVLNLLFIPIWGILGAVYASVAAQVVAVITSSFLGCGAFRLPNVYQDCIRILIAALVMAATILVVPSSNGAIGLMTSIALGVCTYGIALLTFGPGEIRRSLLHCFSKERISTK